MIVDIETVRNANAYIFLQPNNFNKDISISHGILENNMMYEISIYKGKTKGKYEVPTDWTVFISYNYVREEAGSIAVKSWVDEFTDKDVVFIERM